MELAVCRCVVTVRRVPCDMPVAYRRRVWAVAMGYEIIPHALELGLPVVASDALYLTGYWLEESEAIDVFMIIMERIEERQEFLAMGLEDLGPSSEEKEHIQQLLQSIVL